MVRDVRDQVHGSLVDFLEDPEAFHQMMSYKPLNALVQSLDSIVKDERGDVMNCDYCDMGNVAINGWHEISDPEGLEGTARVVCSLYEVERVDYPCLEGLEGFHHAHARCLREAGFVRKNS